MTKKRKPCGCGSGYLTYTDEEQAKHYKFKFESLIDSHSRMAFELYDAKKRIEELEKERKRLADIALEARKRWWDFLLF